MEKKDLQYFRKLLLEKRSEILKGMGIIQENSLKGTNKDASGSDSTYSTHMADQGTDAQEREKAFFYASRENKYIQYLNDALNRIDEGTFGICVECGADIPIERLEAVPITQHCVPCKLKEKR